MRKNNAPEGSRIHRDEVKRRKILDKKKTEMLDTILNVTTAIREDSSLWTSPDFSALRSFAYEVTSKPSIYPPPIDFDVSTSSSTSTSKLSDNFVSRVYQRLVNSRHDEDSDPILHIRAVTTKYRTARFQSNGGNEYVNKQVTLHGVDSKDHVITIKLASQMNGKSGMLKVGSVISIHNFQTVFYDYAKEGKQITSSRVNLLSFHSLTNKCHNACAIY